MVLGLGGASYLGCSVYHNNKAEMSWIPKPIWKEKFRFRSDKSVDDLGTDMKKVFDKAKGWDVPPNIVGTFLTPDKFEAGHKDHFDRSLKASLSGQILQDDKGNTIVELTVWPNIMLAILFLVTLVMTIIGVICASLGYGQFRVSDVPITTIGGKIGFTLIGFIFPLIFFVAAYFTKRDLKNGFAVYFHLKPLDKE